MPLISLVNIKELIIYGDNGPKLLNVDKLKLLKLERIKIFGKVLDPNNPIIPWNEIKKVEFDHISDIYQIGNATFYNIKYIDYLNMNEEFSYKGHLITSDNVILQNINDENFYLMFSKNNTVNAIQLTIQEFTELVLNKKIDNLDVLYPKTREEIYVSKSIQTHCALQSEEE